MGRAADIHLAELLGWVDFHEAMGIWFAISPENLVNPQQPSGIPLKVHLPYWTTCTEVVEDLIERTIKAMVEFNPLLGRTPIALFDLAYYGTRRYSARFRWHNDISMSTGDTIAEAVSKAAIETLEGIDKKMEREVRHDAR